MFGRRFVLIATIVGAVGALTGGSALLFLAGGRQSGPRKPRLASAQRKYVGFWQDNGKYSFGR